MHKLYFELEEENRHWVVPTHPPYQHLLQVIKVFPHEPNCDHAIFFATESKEKGDHRLGFLTLEHRNAWISTFFLDRGTAADLASKTYKSLQKVDYAFN